MQWLAKILVVFTDFSERKGNVCSVVFNRLSRLPLLLRLSVSLFTSSILQHPPGNLSLSLAIYLLCRHSRSPKPLRGRSPTQHVPAHLFDTYLFIYPLLTYTHDMRYTTARHLLVWIGILSIHSENINGFVSPWANGPSFSTGFIRLMLNKLLTNICIYSCIYVYIYIFAFPFSLLMFIIYYYLYNNGRLITNILIFITNLN